MIDEDLDLILDSDDKLPYSGSRPSYLTVFAILTFVGSGLFMLKAFFGYWTYSSMSNLFEATDPLLGGIDNEFDKIIQWTKLCFIAEFISCIICIVGAVLILKMRKIGFYIYLIGALLYSAEVIWYYLVLASGNLHEFIFIWIALYLIAPIAFTVIYGTALKYMK